MKTWIISLKAPKNSQMTMKYPKNGALVAVVNDQAQSARVLPSTQAVTKNENHRKKNGKAKNEGKAAEKRVLKIIKLKIRRAMKLAQI